jgi:hypothetical protein
MKRGIFFVLMLLMWFDLISQNLVVNPGLEIWGVTGKPTGWTNTLSCLKDSAFVNSGSYSCRQEGVTSSRDLGQRIIVSPEKHYRFSLFYKSGLAITGNGCRIWCEWLDINKVSIVDPLSEPVLHSGFLISEEWQQFSADLTSPSGAGYFYLLVRTLPNSITYWDDFIFEESVPTLYLDETFSEIKVYPNPAHDYLNISNLHNLQCIEIQSLTGATIWTSNYKGEENVVIPVTDLSNGVYIIQIRTANRIIAKKIIIE